MIPKVFIVISCGSVTETVVVGDSNVEAVVLDFDELDIEPDDARQILHDHEDALRDIDARKLRERLQDIVDEADLNDEADEEDDEDADMDDDEDMEFSDDDDEEGIDLGDGDDLDAEFDEEDDEKKEEDYNGDEFNVPAPAFPTAETAEAAEFGSDSKSDDIVF